MRRCWAGGRPASFRCATRCWGRQHRSWRRCCMRSALGASRGRVLRQLATEALVPAVTGAALAVLVADFTLTGVLSALSESVRIGMPYLTAAVIDVRIIGLVVGAASALALVFGV